MPFSISCSLAAALLRDSWTVKTLLPPATVTKNSFATCHIHKTKLFMENSQAWSSVWEKMISGLSHALPRLTPWLPTQARAPFHPPWHRLWRWRYRILKSHVSEMYAGWDLATSCNITLYTWIKKGQKRTCWAVMLVTDLIISYLNMYYGMAVSAHIHQVVKSTKLWSVRVESQVQFWHRVSPRLFMLPVAFLLHLQPGSSSAQPPWCIINFLPDLLQGPKCWRIAKGWSTSTQLHWSKWSGVIIWHTDGQTQIIPVLQSMAQDGAIAFLKTSLTQQFCGLQFRSPGVGVFLFIIILIYTHICICRKVVMEGAGSNTPTKHRSRACMKSLRGTNAYIAPKLHRQES